MKEAIEFVLSWWNSNLGWYGWLIVLLTVLVFTLSSSAEVSRAALLVVSGGLSMVALWAISGDWITEQWFKYFGDEEIVDSSVRPPSKEVTDDTVEGKKGTTSKSEG